MIRILALVLMMALTVISPISIFAASDAPVTTDSVDPEWITLETGYLTVYYLPGADLDSIEHNLKKRATYFDSDIPGDSAPVEEKIRYQLDALFRHAEAILDMRPANIHVKIKIFRTTRDLADEYVKIFRSGEPTGEDIKAFYINKYNTIYTSEEDISDSVVAHEMGHAIVDHYFAVIPPEKIRELLASYVDLHLAE